MPVPTRFNLHIEGMPRLDMTPSKWGNLRSRMLPMKDVP